MEVDKDKKIAEVDEKEVDLFFCKAAKKTPPDQIEKLMGLIERVQNLERITKISQ